MFKFVVNGNHVCNTYIKEAAESVADELVYNQGWKREHWAAFPDVIFLYSPDNR